MWFLFSCALIQSPNSSESSISQRRDIIETQTKEEKQGSDFYIPQIPSSGLTFSSAYSNILVQDKGSIRSLYFVRDSGQIVLETAVDLEHPEKLKVPYTRAMFVSEAFFSTRIDSALLIGLGGGAMVHHIHHYWNDQKLDAVDIDPVIVDIAKNYFVVPHSTSPYFKNTSIELHVADGFIFINKAHEKNEKYDVIYMDAFLKPSTDTDKTGIPLRLKTLTFYDELKSILNEDGIVVFNINNNKDINADLQHISDSFEHVWKLAVPNRGNLIVVGCLQEIDETTLFNRATHIDKKKGLGITEWVQRLKKYGR